MMCVFICGNLRLYEKAEVQNGLVEPKSRICVLAVFASQALNKAMSAV